MWPGRLARSYSELCQRRVTLWHGVLQDEREAKRSHFAALLDLSPDWVRGVLDDAYVHAAADPQERRTRAAFRELILGTLRRMDGTLGQQLAKNRRMARALRRMLEEELQEELPRAREAGDPGGLRTGARGPGGDEVGSGARWRRRGVWLRRRRGPNGEAEPLDALGANAVYLGGPGSGLQVCRLDPALDTGFLICWEGLQALSRRLPRPVPCQMQCQWSPCQAGLAEHLISPIASSAC